MPISVAACGRYVQKHAATAQTSVLALISRRIWNPSFCSQNPPSSLFFSHWEVILILLATHTQASLCERGDGNNFAPDDNWQGCNLSMGRWLEVIKHRVWFGSRASPPMTWTALSGLTSQVCFSLLSSWFLPYSSKSHSSLSTPARGRVVHPECRAMLLRGPTSRCQFWLSSATQKEVSTVQLLPKWTPRLSLGTVLCFLPISLWSCCSLDYKLSSFSWRNKRSIFYLPFKGNP